MSASRADADDPRVHPDYVAINRESWTRSNAEYTDAQAEGRWAETEYGASIWCDPYRWIPEAARLLRIRGELVFLCNSPLSTLCMPETGQAGDRLLRPQRGLHRLEWKGDDPGVEFHLGHGEMFQLLRQCGFAVLDLVELYASEDAHDHAYYSYLTADWARRWPSEEIWRACFERRPPPSPDLPL